MYITDFNFRPIGYGHYKVTYTSPKTKKEFTTVTTDMQLIDRTKNAENILKKDLILLKRKCKNN